MVGLVLDCLGGMTNSLCLRPVPGSIANVMFFKDSNQATAVYQKSFHLHYLVNTFFLKDV